jgi:TRAP-type C4-dicarboxylate transport system permease small subunit
MDKLLYLAAPLGCAVMMIACMAMMAKGMRRGHQPDEADAGEVAALRAEVAELRAERAQAANSIDG